MGKLDGKVAVITGAASGIGRATAIRFAHEGAAVTLADLNVEGGEAAARECRASGGKAVFQRTDVAIEGDIRAAIDRTVKQFGRLDIMFNNAGLGGAYGSIDEMDADDWDRTQAVLLRAVFVGMKYSVPEMRKAAGGSIISTSSVAGLRGGYASHAYSTAKAGVINLTRSVALEVGEYKIRVNCICPGGINTPILSRHFPGGEAATEQFIAGNQAIRRAGRPEDIAGLALYLASDDSSWITGSAIVADGGLTAGHRAEWRPLVTAGFVGPSFEL